MKGNKRIYSLILTASILIVLVNACSNVKYLPAKEKLYTGAEVKINTPNKKEAKALKTELELLLRPKPNASFLGLRPQLWLYNISKEPKPGKKGLNYLLHKKWGKPPVLLSSVNLDLNRRIVKNRLENMGYFLTEVTADTISKNRRAQAIYKAETGPQFKIASVHFPTDSTVLANAIRSGMQASLLKVGQPYNLDVIKAERDRIDADIKEKGFFYFNPDYLLIRADSSLKNTQVNLYVVVKKATPQKATKIYTINDIFIYPNYSLRQDSAQNKTKAVLNNGYYVIDPDSTFKSSLFKRAMFFHKGDTYNRREHNLSLNRLINLGTFKFVKPRYADVDSAGKNQLDVFYYLTPFKKRSLRFEAQGVSRDYGSLGSQFTISTRNRNLLRGAELLTLDLTGGFETSGKSSELGGGYNVGISANLYFPRFITPIKVSSTGAFVPKTKLNLAYQLQNRTNKYYINSLSLNGGYTWKESAFKDHDLNLVSINYVQPFSISPDFQKQLNLDPILKRSFEKQFIIGTNYSFTYSNQQETFRKNTFYFRGGIDVAGNLLGLVTTKSANDSVRTLFKQPFAQYARFDIDVRNYQKIGPNSQWVNRFIAGYGYAYGNSKSLPFVKQFFSGGSNSIRAFAARALGPGSFDPTQSSTLLPDQGGDIKLEFNTELRTKLFSIVHGALFADAGNIWLLNSNPQKPGGQFSGKTFLNELALGTGAGLRIDASILVLRLDVAFPLRIPYLPDGKRWVIRDINFGSSSWLRNNLVYNIAIGYPF